MIQNTNFCAVCSTGADFAGLMTERVSMLFLWKNFRISDGAYRYPYTMYIFVQIKAALAL